MKPQSRTLTHRSEEECVCVCVENFFEEREEVADKGELLSSRLCTSRCLYERKRKIKRKRNQTRRKSKKFFRFRIRPFLFLLFLIFFSSSVFCVFHLWLFAFGRFWFGFCFY